MRYNVSMTDLDSQKPSDKEKVALSLFYNKFYHLFNEIIDDSFTKNDPSTRFSKLKEAFLIYKELTSYDPIKEYLKWMKLGGRPPIEGMIADDLFAFIRNLLLHFPIFDTWDDVYVNEDLATWSKHGQIDRFLKRCTKIKIDGMNSVKYRIWEVDKKKMTYFSVNFPDSYGRYNIYLKNIITEEVGMKFCMQLMKNVLDIQLENPSEEKIKIMSQVYFTKRQED